MTNLDSPFTHPKPHQHLDNYLKC